MTRVGGPRPASAPTAARPVDAPANHGQLSVSVKKAKDGFALTVTTRHTQQGELVDLNLFFVMPGGYPIPLKTLVSQAILNPDGYTGARTFELTYADLNASMSKYLSLGNNPNLFELKPGTPLVVGGNWPGGHTWGLGIYGKAGGEFVAP
jgi:hypothetical protein